MNVQPKPVAFVHSNKSYIETCTGFCKVCTIILGVIAVGVGAVAHFRQKAVLAIDHLGEEPEFGERCTFLEPERFFLAVTIISLILSIISLVIDSFTTVTSKRPDSLFHKLAGCFLLIAAGILFYSTLALREKECGEYKNKMVGKLVAAFVTFINSLFYLALGCCALWTKGGQPRETLVYHYYPNPSQPQMPMPNSMPPQPSVHPSGQPNVASAPPAYFVSRISTQNKPMA